MIYKPSYTEDHIANGHDPKGLRRRCDRGTKLPSYSHLDTGRPWTIYLPHPERIAA